MAGSAWAGSDGADEGGGGAGAQDAFAFDQAPDLFIHFDKLLFRYVGISVGDRGHENDVEILPSSCEVFSIEKSV